MSEDFVRSLITWYGASKRTLPWRETADPYRIWVSEIMLQQTRAAAVIPYYERFIRELPDIPHLAACGDERLLKLWEGLGYYSRARNMKKAAVLISEKYDGHFPEEAPEIRKLPGVGSYTAGAIASIAFGREVPAVDGNVLRVWSRIRAYEGNILENAAKKAAEKDVGETFLNKGYHPGDVNQALIELGALVCLPGGGARCGECPLTHVCRAHSAGRTDQIPVRIRKMKRRAEDITVLIVRDGERTAIVRRPETGLLAGMYEFPNVRGHISEKEAVAFVASKGYDALHVRKLPPAKHVFTHLDWNMTGYEIKTGEHADGGAWQFSPLSELESEKPLASAFSAYAEVIGLHPGAKELK